MTDGSETNLLPFLIIISAALAFPVLVYLTVLVLGFVARNRLARRIADGERRVAHLLAVNTPELGPGHQVTLVVGAVVYAVDAPTRNAHGWRKVFGGASDSMRQRMDGARRLATVRALEQAGQLGATAVLNMRYQTSTIGQGQRSGRGAPLVEMIAYGTAWVPAAR